MNVLQERGRDAVNVRPHGTGRIVPMPSHLTPEQRFWSKVNKDGPTPACAPNLGACWLWTAALNLGGYGLFWIDGRMVMAHRWLYEHQCGPIDADTLDHLCRTHSCIRPTHLEPVTNKVNTMRGIGPTALNAQKSHCPEGHSYDLFNTRFRPDGHRDCRHCGRIATKRYKRRQRE